MNRRNFLTTALAAAAPLPAARPAARPLSYAHDYPDMLLAWMGARLNALAGKWDAERAKIRTGADVHARNRFVREKARAMVHGFPERCPLAPEVVRTHERDGYRVEDLMFQSLPDFWVTANLYIPAGRPPFPAVISPCGHYPNARMEPEYQEAYLNMVKAGFVVLAYDPIGQGERRQYWDPRTGRTEVSTASTFEHSMPGQVLLLMGQDLTHYRIWDGMRAIDYLETRPEVDRSRIGCAGHSGGGTLTLFISALDERVKCAVVNEGGTNHRWPVEFRPEARVGPSDVEQNLFPAAVYGVDLCDLHVAIAPRPLLALIEDFNPRFNLAAGHIRERYRQLGVPEKFGTAEATDPHSWTYKLRQATTDWLSRWFYGRPGPAREPEFTLESNATLCCTPNGSIRDSHKGRTIFTILAEEAERLPPDPSRKIAAGEIAKCIGYRRHEGELATRLLVTTGRKGYRVEKLEFISEPGIYIPAWVFVPDGAGGRLPSILWVNEAGKEADGVEFGPCEKLARSGKLVIAMDVRGAGATRPPHNPPSNFSNEFAHLFDVETAIAYMAWFMDQSLFGMRVGDVVRGVDYALSRPDVARDSLQVVGKGAGALWCLYAAALDERIRSLTAERMLLSYGTLARTDRYAHGAGIFVRDVLLHFDLPQVAAAIAPRELTIAAPVDPMKRPVDRDTAEAAYRTAAGAYRNVRAEARFRIT